MTVGAGSDGPEPVVAAASGRPALGCETRPVRTQRTALCHVHRSRRRFVACAPIPAARLPYPEPMQRLPTLLVAAALAAAGASASCAMAEGGAGGGHGAAAAATAAAAAGAPAFSDVPPCHWAARAVAKTAGDGIFVGFPPDPAYDSVNALRQVFEGLRCGAPAWSLRFLTGASGAFPADAAPALASFTLDTSIEAVSAGEAELAFELTAVVDRNGTRRTLTRQGTVTATRTGAGWQVAYADLAGLDLPFFPR